MVCFYDKNGESNRAVFDCGNVTKEPMAVQALQKILNEVQAARPGLLYSEGLDSAASRQRRRQYKTMAKGF